MFVEDDLFDERAICEAIFKHSAEAILITDSKARIIHANPSVLSLFQYSFYELMMQNVEVLVPESARQAHHDHVADYSKKTVHRSMNAGRTLYGRKKDGTLFPIKASLSPAKIGEQKVIVALVIDVSEIIENKNKLRALNEELEIKVEQRTKELADLVDELEKTNKKLKKERNKAEKALEKEKELNDLQTRFVSMASHEFRTPLSTILSSLTLLEKYDDIPGSEEKKKKHYKRVNSNVKHLTSVLNDFLSLDKLQTENRNVPVSLFNLKVMVEILLSDFNGILKTGQSISLSFSGKEEVNSNLEALKICISNLLSNASKYSEEGKKIKLSISTESGINIKVEDEGIGIPKEDKKHMFDRFFRAKNVINIQGTGIGLTVIKRYMDLLGGEISFSSEENKGTTFEINIKNK